MEMIKHSEGCKKDDEVAKKEFGIDNYSEKLEKVTSSFVPLLERIEALIDKIVACDCDICKGCLSLFKEDKTNFLLCLRELDDDLKKESLKAEERERPNESIAYSNARMYVKKRFGNVKREKK